jgi:hypothetical protein
VDVVLLDVNENIFASAQLELNEEKLPGEFMNIRTRLHRTDCMRMARATECFAMRRVSFTQVRTSRIHSSHWGPPTGEPDAGNPPVRFGGRGRPKGLSLPLYGSYAGFADGQLHCA